MSKNIIEKKNNTILKLTLILDNLFTVLDDFQQNLNDFQNSCKCIENFRNKLNFNELEDNYKTIVEEYNEHKSKIEEELDLKSDVFKSTADRQTSDPINGEDSVHKTTSQKNVQGHKRRAHLKKSKCIKCEFRCFGRNSLHNHMRSNHSDSIDWFICPFDDCPHMTYTKKNMNQHINDIHRDKKPLYCDDCPFKCWGIKKLKLHQNTDHKNSAIVSKGSRVLSKMCQNKGPKKYFSHKCMECGHSYRSESQLQNHIDWSHNKGFLIIKDKNFFRCFHTTCAFFDKNWSVVLDHIKHDHNEKKVIKHRIKRNKAKVGQPSIEESSADFVFGSNLFKQLRHRNEDKSKQTKEEAIDCNQSSQVITSSKDKSAPIFSGKPSKKCEKDFKCGFCELRTTSMCALKYHMGFVHSSFKCYTCSQVFASEMQLEEHHNNYCFALNYYFCGQNYCKFECNDITILEEHQRNHSIGADTHLIESCNKDMSEQLTNLSKVKSIPKVKSRPRSKVNKNLITEGMLDTNTEAIEICPQIKTEPKDDEPLQDVNRDSMDDSPQEMDCLLTEKYMNSSILKSLLRTDDSQMDESSPVSDQNKIQEQFSDNLLKSTASDQYRGQQSTPVLSFESTAHPLIDPSSNSSLKFESTQESIEIKSEPQESQDLTSIGELNNPNKYMEILSKESDEKKTEDVFNNKSNSSSEAIKVCPKSHSIDNYSKVCVKSEECQPLVTEQNIIDKNNKSDENEITFEDNSNVEEIDGRLNNEGNNDLEAFLRNGNRPGYLNATRQTVKRVTGRGHFSVKHTTANLRQRTAQKETHYCLKCGHKSRALYLLHKHIRKVHHLFVCSICQTNWISSEALAQHRGSAHSSPNLFKCEANECRFECNDSQEFSEHKRQHLTKNIDKIITDFQTDIKRVDIKTELKEQDNHFVNAEDFLVKNNGETQDFSDSGAQNNQNSDVCPQQTLCGGQSTSGTVKRVRGLNSTAREPIRLFSKSTKKISELFKN